MAVSPLGIMFCSFVYIKPKRILNILTIIINIFIIIKVLRELLAASAIIPYNPLKKGPL